MASTITVVCPQCKNKVRASAEHVGRQGRCPKCNALVPIKAADPGSMVMLAPDGASAVVAEAHMTDVNPWIAAVIGGFATCFLYIFFYAAYWFRPKLWIGQFMCHRSWIQHTITFVTCWAITLLIMKFIAVRRQIAHLGKERELFPPDIGMQITTGNVDKFLAHLAQPEHQGSILVGRVRGALNHFKFRESVPEVQGYLSTQASIDASGVDSGYTLLRAFIWVCPILGFVGTVIGISDAISELKISLDKAAVIAATDSPEGAKAVEKAMTEGLGKVTDGLATAFDTTLLGLICVILLLFPTEILRKVEYASLDRIEAYANESILRSMSEGGPALDKDPAGYAREALQTAFQQHQQWLAQWQEQVGRIGVEISGKFESAIRDGMRRIAQDEAARLDRIGKMSATLNDVLEQALRSTEAASRASERSTSDAERAADIFGRFQDRLAQLDTTIDQFLQGQSARSDRQTGSGPSAKGGQEPGPGMSDDLPSDPGLGPTDHSPSTRIPSKGLADRWGV